MRWVSPVSRISLWYRGKIMLRANIIWQPFGNSMKKEAKSLHGKAVDSLVLAIDHFNRAWDRGRCEVVLILLDRAFELLLKSIIIHNNGIIREKKKEGTTIGFDLCLRKCLSDKSLQCITEDEAIALQNLNSLRDAAQHYMIEMSEEQLYVYSQAAVTLFARLTENVLKRPLRAEIPQRVLPICAKAPSELCILFDTEFAEIKRMVAPGSRKRLDARARLRSMAILQASLDGRKSLPSDGELDRVVRRINTGEDWRKIFPGVATLKIEPDANGPGLSLCITRNQGEAIQLTKEGDPDAAVVAVKRVNELDFYSLGLHDLAKKLKITAPRLLCLIRADRMQNNPNFFKLIKIGKTPYKRYSPKCLQKLKERLSEVDLEILWAAEKSAA